MGGLGFGSRWQRGGDAVLLAGVRELEQERERDEHGQGREQERL